MPIMESIEKKCLDKSAFKKINLSLYNILKSIVVNIFFPVQDKDVKWTYFDKIRGFVFYNPGRCRTISSPCRLLQYEESCGRYPKSGQKGFAENARMGNS